MKIIITAEKHGYVTREDFKHLRIDHRRRLITGKRMAHEARQRCDWLMGRGRQEFPRSAPSRLCRDRSRRGEVDAQDTHDAICVEVATMIESTRRAMKYARTHGLQAQIWALKSEGKPLGPMRLLPAYRPRDVHPCSETRREPTSCLLSEASLRAPSTGARIGEALQP